jgi:hypothetical protein
MPRAAANWCVWTGSRRTRSPLAAGVVQFDRRHNTYTVTKHLIDLGHRSLGIFLGPGVGVRPSYIPARMARCWPARRPVHRSACPPALVQFRRVSRSEGRCRHRGAVPGACPRRASHRHGASQRPHGDGVYFPGSAGGPSGPGDVSVVGHDNDEMSAFSLYR